MNEDESDLLWTFNVGAAVGRLNGLVVRPEIGFLLNPGEEGHFRNF